MREYKVINDKALKQSTRIYGAIAGFGLITVGIFIQSYYTSIVGIIIVMAIIFKKDIVFNEDGYLTVYDFILFKYKELWKYTDISYIHKQPAPNKAYMGVLIQKDMTFKRAILPIEMIEPILSLAKEKNPTVHIGTVD